MKKSLELLEFFGETVSRDMKETVAHGSRQFRMSVHMTKVPPINNVVLYSHWHEELEFLFLAKGSALVHIGQEKVKVRSGEIVFIPPNLLHSASRLDREEIVFYAVLVHFNFLSSLENDRIQQQYILPLFMQNLRYPHLITREMDEELHLYPLLEDIRDVYQQEPPGYELLVKAKLLEILYRLQTRAVPVDADQAFGKAKGHPSLLAKKVLAYVQQNYGKRITLADMAQHVNLSLSYFCRFMKKQFDLSPMDFLNEYRISEAISLMETTDKTITEIAELTGFCNVNRFTETFKKFYGCTSAYYRNAIRNHEGQGQYTVRRDTDLKFM
ncbi:AraC family transcriptional regulator [Paenibacillus phocaensis]|uniref:AraC family transcriptional regulator n=1 Tax=Paenibacillus phocaensis TaxID=1776378 RepID=UPI000839D400|nr:AraC family transcriptional regulator [Paenibacillus phocaensis]